MDKQTDSNTRSVLLIDEHPVCGDGLKRLFRKYGNFSLQCAVTGMEEIDAREAAGIIAIEIASAKSKGIGAIRELRKRFPLASVLALSRHDEILFAERCLKAGAKGYVMKTAPAEEIIEAFQTVAEGGIYISEHVRTRLLSRISGQAPDDTEQRFNDLSDRELLIVQHIGQSRNNHEIARELNISIKTIESHRSRIKSKLRLGSPNELVRYAMRLHNATF